MPLPHPNPPRPYPGPPWGHGHYHYYHHNYPLSSWFYSVYPSSQWVYPGPIAQSTGKQLVLTVTRAGGALSAQQSVQLTCDPAYGTHPRATEACAELALAQGDPALIRPLSGVACTQQYDPVTATATGLWNGRAIRFERTFGNACLMSNATGSVFAF
ncbi:SSI family serine proteinase inhibitor [Streptosporangium sp. NPDC000396]|uniref:SSI family serine proteinase inhibitor n=1 Tax=Streptosporangium sp. NPDC000396 TaxID=3366185 RepID=UPI0036B87674